MTFEQRKRSRALAFFRYRYGWILDACTACMGSGRYDADGSPPCGACDGTGKARVRGPKALTHFEAAQAAEGHLYVLDLREDLTATKKVAYAVMRRDDFKFKPGMYLRAGNLEMRLTRSSCSEIEDGENPWYQWRIREPVWIDIRDPETVKILNRICKGWRDQ